MVDEVFVGDAVVPEQEPGAAAVIFGARLDVARAFTEDLATRGEPLGLIGPLEAARIWTRHVLNSALVAPFLQPGRVADVGSGGGLPGIVLAIARPDVEFTLIEPMERRVAWLDEQVTALDLSNVRVLRERAEDAVNAGPFDQVTARAVSALRKLIPLTVPLLRAGGELVLMKGAGAEAEIAAAQKLIARFKLADVRVAEAGVGVVSEPTRVVLATKRS